MNCYYFDFFLFANYVRGNNPMISWILMGWHSVLSSPTDLSKCRISGLIKSGLFISLFLSFPPPTVCFVLGTPACHGRDEMLAYLCGYDALIPFFCYHKDGLVHWIPWRTYRWYSTFRLFTKAGQREKRCYLTSNTPDSKMLPWICRGGTR